MSAVLSHCEKYRWILGRELKAFRLDRPRLKGTVLWVMLNPSTADAELDDPTIRRVIEFSRAWGYTKILVVNLYALRATDPKELWVADDPVGAENDAWIHQAAQGASRVILGWGAHAKRERVAEVYELLTVDNPVVYCLGTNADGSPKHPLYLKNGTVLEVWDLPE